MRLRDLATCAVSGCFSLLLLSLLGAPSFAQTTAAPPDSKSAAEASAPVPTKPPEESQIPLVVRIDKTALFPYTNSTRRDDVPVDKHVLGSRAVGDSVTIGESRAVLLPDSQEATFDIVYQGRTSTTTAAYASPAVVYSRTYTDFTCTSRIVFEPHRGFMMVGETQITGDTRLVLDGAAATQRLGRRIIPRIAMRKAYQLHEAGRRIADRDNKRDVRVGFEKEVAQQVANANKGLDIVRYVNRFLGEDSSLQLFAKSSTDCIHIGLGPEGEKFAPMTALPPRGENPAPIEIWVHSSLLGQPTSALLAAATPAVALPLGLQSQVLDLLSLGGDDEEATAAAAALPADDEEPNDSIDVDFHDGWLVLGLPQEPPPQIAAKSDTERK